MVSDFPQSVFHEHPKNITSPLTNSEPKRNRRNSKANKDQNVTFTTGKAETGECGRYRPTTETGRLSPTCATRQSGLLLLAPTREGWMSPLQRGKAQVSQTHSNQPSPCLQEPGHGRPGCYTSAACSEEKETAAWLRER